MADYIKANLRIGKHRYYKVEDCIINLGDFVIVEEEESQDIAKVIKVLRGDKFERYNPNLKKILRKVTSDDFKQLEKIKEEEKNIFNITLKKIRNYNLPMELTEVKTFFDRSKVIFYFFAEKRVDFRELVRNLASTFKARIEMHHIGSRDEAKKISGIGPCGYQLCCNTFLQNFGSVNIKMAKEQNLPLTPVKISGVCGRLLCCLNYEYEIYTSTREKMPQEGTVVITPKGEGKVMEINVPKETLIIELEDGVKVEFKKDEIKPV